MNVHLVEPHRTSSTCRNPRLIRVRRSVFYRTSRIPRNYSQSWMPDTHFKFISNSLVSVVFDYQTLGRSTPPPEPCPGDARGSFVPIHAQ